MKQGINLAMLSAVSLFGTLACAVVPQPAHSWDFRGCTDGTPVLDSIGGSLAGTSVGTTVCTADGIDLGGIGHVSLTPWEWGGPFTFEMFVKVDAFVTLSRLFHFSPPGMWTSCNVENCIMAWVWAFNGAGGVTMNIETVDLNHQLDGPD